MTVFGRRARVLTLRTGMSVGLLAVLFHRIDPSHIWATFSSMHIAPFAVACTLFFAAQVLSAFRWKIVMSVWNQPAPGVGYLNGLVHVGMFFNFFLSSTVGGTWCERRWCGQSLMDEPRRTAAYGLIVSLGCWRQSFWDSWH